MVCWIWWFCDSHLPLTKCWRLTSLHNFAKEIGGSGIELSPLERSMLLGSIPKEVGGKTKSIWTLTYPLKGV